MSGKRRTDMMVLHAAGATVASMAIGAPFIAALAAAAAAVAVATGRDDLVFSPVSGRSPATDADGPEPPKGLQSMAFHGFEGDDALLHDVPDDDESDAGADPRSDEEQMVDDLTADLDGDDEISFLPPYASDRASQSPAEDDESLAILWEPAPDRSLLEVLNDVLEPSSKMPMPRRFALGTVGILRNLLQPSDVERILAEQKRYPRLRFGDVAVQLGMLTEGELAELLAAQEEGVFTDEEILDTRARLEAYHLESRRRESA